MSSDDRGISDYYNVKIILQFLLTVVFFLYWICYRLKFDVRCICWSVLWCLAPLSTIFQSFISWWSVLLVEETRVPGENHQPVVSHWQTLSHNVVHLAMSGIRTFGRDRYFMTRPIQKQPVDVIIIDNIASYGVILIKQICKYKSLCQVIIKGSSHYTALFFKKTIKSRMYVYNICTCQGFLCLLV